MTPNSFSLLIALAMLQGGGGEEPKLASVVYNFSGTVLDIFESKSLFEGDQVLLSFGADQRARKGMKGYLQKDEPKPSYFEYMELMEVGTKHSIGRAQNAYRLYLGPVQKSKQLQIGDSVIWFSIEMRPVLRVPQFQGRFERGGAIIDLTHPGKKW
jgi:hypothetical protein